MAVRRAILLIVVPVIVLLGLASVASALLDAAQVDLFEIMETWLGPSVTTERLSVVAEFMRLPLQLVFVLVIFLIALVVSKLSYRLAGWLLDAARIGKPVSDATSEPETTDETDTLAAPARRETLQQLVASMIGFTAFTVASLIAVGQFVSLTNLAILATVLANAFGFAARDYVGDLLNGVSNLFEDRFDVGDNIEVVRVEDEIRGVVEQVNIRTIGLRTRSGELVIVPQGQVRILRNFTRGAYTGTTVTVAVDAVNLLASMRLLTDLGQEAPELLPDLLEPWRVISQEGDLNTVSELVIHAKADYGRGAQLRLDIMALVEKRLAEASITLAG